MGRVELLGQKYGRPDLVLVGLTFSKGADLEILLGPDG